MADLSILTTLPIWVLGIGLFLVYVVGLSVQRLYFSPIADFPGPKLAALTFWYEFYHDVIRGGQYTFKIGELHDQYGPIIRINPYEIHIRDCEFYDKLYTGASSLRDKWAWTVGMFGNSSSAFGTTSHDLHRVRRSALNPFFSKQSVTRLEPVIRSYVEKMCARFENLRKSGEPVETMIVYAALTTDIICEYSYSKSYGCLDDPGWKHEWLDSMNFSVSSVHLNKHFGWLFPMMEATPEWIVQRLNPAVMILINFQKDLAVQIKDLMNCPASLKNSANPTIFQALVDGDLPPAEKSVKRLVDEGSTVIGAAQQTTSYYLKTVTYHVLANPSIHARLQDELKVAIPNPDNIPSLPQLEALPYLHAVVQEGFRISYGITSRLQRISPDQPLQYQQWSIPAGTPISMTSIFQHEDPKKFPNPKCFDPDRWLNDDERLDKYLVTFSKGTRQCLGMNLAIAEIYITVATVFRRFDMELFETTRRDADVAHDYFVPLGPKDSKGVRIIFK